MSHVYFIGDLHLGHKNVTRFRTQFQSVEEHDAYILDKWAGLIMSRDLVFCLGDVAFTLQGLQSLRPLPGRKVLVRGNHDRERLHQYLDIFENIHGMMRYKKSWLTHCPVHPSELRGKFNIHGHAHSDQYGLGYFNVCAEFVDYTPINYQEILSLVEAE